MDSQKVQYRIATQSDAEDIGQLHASSWRRHYSGIFNQKYLAEDVIQDRLNVWKSRFSEPNESQWVVLAEKHNTLCGFACVFFSEDEKWGSLLDNLHVGENLQRCGLGRALMQKVGTWLWNKDSSGSMYLWVLAKNDRAIRFYEKIKGTRVEDLTQDIPGGGSAQVYRYAWDDLALLI